MANLTVLLIEDEEMVIDVASMMLQRLGCTVEVSKTGSQAIEQLKNNLDKYDLLIIDYNLPDMTAVECLNEMRGFSKTPAVLSSGFGNKLSKEECDKLLITAVLSKPFSLNQLETILNEVQ